MSKEFQFDQNSIDFVRRNLTNKLKFRLLLKAILPMGYRSKMYISEMNEEMCAVKVPFNKRNSNPFKSTFWAVQGMAAEMSSGALLILYTQKQPESIAMLVMDMHANFVKKAADVSTFVCKDGLKIRAAIKETIETGAPVLIDCKMIGENEKGEVVSNFSFTWSVKCRAQK
ncbi:DUF4442 domain-containing protein [Flavobacteriales bacterium]|jgi:hypothetical protein|nr:DUF4442 domain-containing protein [Flavobacteriales bacterium]